MRVWGVRWSLPYVAHPDESLIVDAGVRIVKSGDLNPHFFQYPSLVIYLQAAIYKLNLLWGTWRGYYAGPQSLPSTNHIIALAPDLYLWGRTLSALVGAATVVGVYALGRAVFGRAAGFVAALLLLASPLHIEQSHYLVTDAVMTACALGALAAAWRLATRPGLWIALLAGALVGLCAAAKYNGLFIGLTAATGWSLAWLGHRARPWRYRLAIAFSMVLAAAVTFLITNPYMLLDWPLWSRDLQLALAQRKPASTLDAMRGTLMAQIGALWATDPAILVVGTLGGVILLVVALHRHARRVQRAAWLLLPFAPLYVLFISRYEAVYERYMIIVLPFLCLTAGYGLVLMAGLLTVRLSITTPAALRNPTLLAGVAGLLLVAEPARQMVNFDRYLAEPDSRNAAFAWVQAQLREGHRAAVELHPWLTCAPSPWPCVAPDLYAPQTQLTDRPPSWYARRGYDYVMLVGKEKAVLDRDDPDSVDPRRPPGALAEWLALPQVRSFAGDHEGGKGPEVLVFKVGDGPPEMAGVTRSGARFGDVAQLWGYALTPLKSKDGYYDPAAGPPPSRDVTYHAGGAIGLDLYWRALKDGSGDNHNWTEAVHLSNERGAVVAQVDVVPFSNGRARPVRDWYANEFLAAPYNVPLPLTLAPGVYRLTVGMYDAPKGSSLPVITSSYRPPAPDLDLGPNTVGP